MRFGYQRVKLLGGVFTCGNIYKMFGNFHWCRVRYYKDVSIIQFSDSSIELLVVALGNVEVSL